ncbi:tastin [Perognathus longimembris pacificus]|uniref:tastin n=1 Tax=Perognathus longimembris pacificus TaxID=214514 RepID=UPI0020198E5C|nr:tastin [Perognathus longimembris pacificus]XP_048221039.1 tastin [Perognathus longimembris pacificus]
MTTLQATKHPRLRGVSPTPSKIPIRSQRRPPFSTVKLDTLDQENQDPRILVQKPPLGIQRSLVDSASPRLKAMHQTEKSQSLVGNAQQRNPLEELKPSPGGQNVGPGPPPQTGSPAAIEFVADPAALATILSGEGVKSHPLGRQSSLAQRVLVRGSKGGTTRRGQNARASAYLAPRTPIHRLDSARASCFSRLEGPGPRSQTLCPQRLEALSTRPSLQELRRETGGSSRTSVKQVSRLLLETPVQPASSLSEEHEIIPHSDEGGGALLGLAQRVPLRETREITHAWVSGESHVMPSPAPLAQPLPGRVVPPSVTHPSPFGQAQRVLSPGFPTLTPYSKSLRRLAVRPKVQFTPIRSVPRVQQARWPSGLSPQPCPEEPATPWEQITVQLFDQDGYVRMQERSGYSTMTSPSGPHPDHNPSLQELKMQRISVLQQLLRQEMEGLAMGKCVPLNGGSSLDMVELQPLLTEISKTLNAPEHNSGTPSLPGLSKHPGLPEPCLPEEYEEPQPFPGVEAEVAQFCPPPGPGPPESCCRFGPETPAFSQEQPKIPEPCTSALPGLLQSSPHEQQAALPEACPPVEQGASVAYYSLEPRSPDSSLWLRCNQGTPATTSLTFSSQRPLCASPPIHSLQSQKPSSGQAGPSCLAPRTLALRQRLKACLTAIHHSHEARLDDECAFYTSRTPPPGTTRVCTNPVAELLEWQEALRFIPVGSTAPKDSTS